MDKRKDRYHGLERWLELSQKIFGSLELESTARTILDIALELTDMERGFISLFESGHTEFLMGRTSKRRTLPEEQFGNAEFIVNKCIQQGQAIYFSGPTTSGFCVPLFSYRSVSEVKEMIGVWYEECPILRECYPDEKELVSVIALHAGMALGNVRLYEMATRDRLTGVYQRHYFDSVSFVEWKRTVRYMHPMSILIVDLDDFKEINETYGRKEGDAVLRKTAAVLKDACRVEDILARYGDEEFVALFPETNVSGVKRVARRVQENMSLLVFTPDGKPVGVSIGVACYPQCAVNNVQNLVRLAEIATRSAYEQGRNRTVVYMPALSSAHTRIFQ